MTGINRFMNKLLYNTEFLTFKEHLSLKNASSLDLLSTTLVFLRNENWKAVKKGSIVPRDMICTPPGYSHPAAKRNKSRALCKLARSATSVSTLQLGIWR